jgi:hypothetical protein
MGSTLHLKCKHPEISANSLVGKFPHFLHAILFKLFSKCLQQLVLHLHPTLLTWNTWKIPKYEQVKKPSMFGYAQRLACYCGSQIVHFFPIFTQMIPLLWKCQSLWQFLNTTFQNTEHQNGKSLINSLAARINGFHSDNKDVFSVLCLQILV